MLEVLLKDIFLVQDTLSFLLNREIRFVVTLGVYYSNSNLFIVGHELY